MNQRILSVVLTLVLVLGVFGASPLTASATTGGPPVHLFNISGGDIIVETDLGHAGRLQVTYGGGVVEDNIDPGDTIQITGTSDVQVADDPSCHVIVDGVTANITIEDLHIEVPNYTTPADNQPPFALKSGADVTLTVTGNNNILKSHSTSDNNAAKNAALDVSTGNSINIKGTGVLTATSGNMSAAIGGSNAIAAGSITIGGTVQILATTGGRSCGIGSGMNSTSTGMSIIIEDNAQVTAIGSEGAAIGIGNLSSGTVSITIKDSAQVNASGGSGDGAGIGGGYTNNTNGANDSQTIVVNIQGNANVTAIGGTGGGAGIGTGYNWAGSGNKPHTLTVNIDGTATVEATATGTGYNNNSPGIGLAGENGSGGTATIDITSPNVTATASTVAGKGYAPAIGASDPGVTPAITYPVVITGGGSGATASGSYSATAPLNINAGTRNGYTFDGWTTTSAHVVFDNAASATTFFSIPVDEVTISGPSTAVVGWDANLRFTDSASYDIPSSTVGTGIANIDVSGGANSGITPYAFSAAGLPAGISIAPSTGVISGIPTTAGPAGTATVTVTDSVAGTRNITINYGIISPPLVFTDSASYDIPVSKAGKGIANIGVSGGVSGGTAPYAFSADGLPAGISINAATGVISGTPTTSGAKGTATLTVTDSVAATESIKIKYGKISAADVQPVTYQVHTHFGTFAGSGTNTARVLGEHSKFLRLEYGGSVVDPANYTTWSGSTYIQLKEAHLKTYANGTHYFTAVYSDGISENIRLDVNVTGDNTGNTGSSSPKTGDDMNIALLIAICGTALAALTLLFILRRQLRMKNGRQQS